MVLAPVADAALDKDAPDRNFGADALLPLSGGAARSAVLRFELPPWLATATVERAWLWVRITGEEERLLHVRVIPLQYRWSEAGISWNTAAMASAIDTASAAGLAAAPSGTSEGAIAISGGDHWWHWDITYLVQAWASGELANEGLILSSEDESAAQDIYVMSREGDRPAILDVRLAWPSEPLGGHTAD